MLDIVLKSDFDKIKNFVEKCAKSIIFAYDNFLVINGYKDYYIGQKIKVEFNDNEFKKYDLNLFIIDILIEKDLNFGLLLVPEDSENLFPSINPLLKEIGIDNLNVPKTGCFFAKHLGRDKFVLENEEKNFVFSGVNACLMVPKLFNMPKSTKEKILIYNKLRTKELPESIKRIIE